MPGQRALRGSARPDRAQVLSTTRPAAASRCPPGHAAPALAGLRRGLRFSSAGWRRHHGRERLHLGTCLRCRGALRLRLRARTLIQHHLGGVALGARETASSRPRACTPTASERSAAGKKPRDEGYICSRPGSHATLTIAAFARFTRALSPRCDGAAVERPPSVAAVSAYATRDPSTSRASAAPGTDRR